MEKPPQIIAEEIHLLKIDVVQNKIDVSGFKKVKNPKLGLAHKLMHILKDEMLMVELAFSFTDEKDRQILLLRTDFHFHIEKMENFYQLEEDGKPAFFTPMVATLLGIAISTARGLVFEKLENNGIKNIIVPVVSPHKILTQSH